MLWDSGQDRACPAVAGRALLPGFAGVPEPARLHRRLRRVSSLGYPVTVPHANKGSQVVSDPHILTGVAGQAHRQFALYSQLCTLLPDLWTLFRVNDVEARTLPQ